jgi:hypothetical protein
MAKLNLSQKKSKKNKQKKTARKQWKGGKCGCSSSFFSGGNASHAPYPLNSHSDNPQMAVSTRIMPNTIPNTMLMKGGKRHLRKMNTRKRHQQRKMKGGFAFVLSGTDTSLRNPISSGLSLQGAVTGTNILTGNHVSNAGPYMSNQVSNLFV